MRSTGGSNPWKKRRSRTSTGRGSEIQKLIVGADLPPELAEAISQAYTELAEAAGGAVKVALRSSAIGEDAADTSFAGQYHSELNVGEDNLHAVYKEVLASKYALTAVSYRLHKGLRDEDVAMCVGCMVMVDSVCGGVMYSRDPTDSRSDAIFLNAVHGLAKSVVDGTVTPDLWVISRGEPLTILQREIRDKGQKVVCLPEEGVRLLEPTPGGWRPPSRMTRPWNWPGSPWRWSLILKDPRISSGGSMRRDASLSSRAAP